MDMARPFTPSVYNCILYTAFLLLHVHYLPIQVPASYGQQQQDHRHATHLSPACVAILASLLSHSQRYGEDCTPVFMQLLTPSVGVHVAMLEGHLLPVLGLTHVLPLQDVQAGASACVTNAPQPASLPTLYQPFQPTFPSCTTPLAPSPPSATPDTAPLHTQSSSLPMTTLAFNALFAECDPVMMSGSQPSVSSAVNALFDDTPPAAAWPSSDMLECPTPLHNPAVTCDDLSALLSVMDTADADWAQLKNQDDSSLLQSVCTVASPMAPYSPTISPECTPKGSSPTSWWSPNNSPSMGPYGLTPPVATGCVARCLATEARLGPSAPAGQIDSMMPLAAFGTGATWQSPFPAMPTPQHSAHNMPLIPAATAVTGPAAAAAAAISQPGAADRVAGRAGAPPARKPPLPPTPAVPKKASAGQSAQKQGVAAPSVSKAAAVKTTSKGLATSLQPVKPPTPSAAAPSSTAAAPAAAQTPATSVTGRPAVSKQTGGASKKKSSATESMAIPASQGECRSSLPHVARLRCQHVALLRKVPIMSGHVFCSNIVSSHIIRSNITYQSRPSQLGDCGCCSCTATQTPPQSALPCF